MINNCRYILLLLLLIAVSSVTSYAQRYYEPNVAIGGKAGISISRTNFAPSIPQSMILGSVIGVTARYMEEKNFGLIAELNMEQRGWKETFEETSYQYERRLTYIQLPILTHIFFGSDKFKGFFNLGPEIGFLIGDSKKANFDIIDAKKLPNFPPNHRTDQYTLPINSKIDYGISAGLGGEYIVKKKNSIMLEGRFYYGLGNIFSSHKTDVFSASPGMSIMVSLSYMYRIK